MRVTNKGNCVTGQRASAAGSTKDWQKVQDGLKCIN